MIMTISNANVKKKNFFTKNYYFLFNCDAIKQLNNFQRSLNQFKKSEQNLMTRKNFVLNYKSGYRNKLACTRLPFLPQKKKQFNVDVTF